MSPNASSETPTPQTPSAPRLSSKPALVLLAALVAAYELGVFALEHFTHVSPSGGLALKIGMGAVLMAAVFVVCARWWRSKDEAQQEAQKWAWYWGGGLGLMVLVPILFVMTFDNARPLVMLLAAIGSAGNVGMAFKLGIVSTLLPMCIGGLIARAIWWRRRR